MVNFRFTILPEWEVDSVVDIYKGALNMEREVVDLFGLRYKGVEPGLFLVLGKSPVAPLRKKRAPEVKGGESRWLGPRSYRSVRSTPPSWSRSTSS